ncbi:restriction endonuclease [Microbacterium maritypicum]
MRHFGIADAEVTQQSSDGGSDVTSSTHVAQSKHYVGTVGGPDIQGLAEAANPLRRAPRFLTSGRYTPAAMARRPPEGWLCSHRALSREC